MLQRLLAGLLSLAVTLPFCLVGIFVAYQVSLFSLGIGPDDKSVAFLVLFLPAVAFCTFTFTLLAYGLLLGALRAIGLDAWFERNTPQGKRSFLDPPFQWVQRFIHRLIPARARNPNYVLQRTAGTCFA